MDHCLGAVEVTGLDTILLHNRMIDSLAALRAAPAIGEWGLDEKGVTYVRMCVATIINNGKIPGRLTKGYEELLDVLSLRPAAPAPPAPAQPEPPSSGVLSSFALTAS
jgi:hypothetical protein